MSYLIIGYPHISTEDFEWIQSIRENHDPKYFNLVMPHITFVFSTDKLSPEELLKHAEEKLRSVKKFNLQFDFARVIEDDSKAFYHAFLIPSIGFEDINKYHDILYTGMLSSELRLDIPFIPHLGIGTSNEKEEMDKLVNEVNENKISIKGMMNELTLVRYDGNKVVDIAKISLK